MPADTMLPRTLYQATQVRELDRRAIEQLGIPGATLMERAGSAAFALLRARWPRALRLAVVCGPGNNGGDGYVVARLALERGLVPTVLRFGATPRAPGEAAAARAACEAAGVMTEAFSPARLADADVIVDALLGIGLERELAGEWRAAVEAVNAARRPVLALDVPSGLDADTGAVLGAAVRATCTMSFIGLKAGLFTGEGPDHAGRIHFSDLGLPAEAYAGSESLAERLTREPLKGLMRRRPRGAHKGSFGHVLVVGGDRGMPGAARLAGEAALRGGAGLVTLAVHPAHAAAVNAARAELIAHGVKGAAALKPLLARATVVALGPGLGRVAWGGALFNAALQGRQPLVLDADALFLLAGTRKKRADWVLTPHPGEAARLLATDTATIQRDRFAAARAIANRHGGVCVLKGAGTVIADSDGRLAVCDRGNPGMASGGMGDVLTGIIAALRAQGLGAWDAACLGAWLHATAGDEAARGGEIGLIASDLLARLPAVLQRLTDDDA
jgi:NAD(P)H-hydrate epimerase